MRDAGLAGRGWFIRSDSTRSGVAGTRNWAMALSGVFGTFPEVSPPPSLRWQANLCCDLPSRSPLSPACTPSSSSTITFLLSISPENNLPPSSAHLHPHLPPSLSSLPPRLSIHLSCFRHPIAASPSPSLESLGVPGRQVSSHRPSIISVNRQRLAGLESPQSPSFLFAT